MNDKYISNATFDVVQDIMEKRMEACRKHGDGADYPPGKWLIILMEEIGEIAQCLQVDEPWSKETDKGDKYEEITDAAAVLIRWAESIKAKM